MTTCSNFLIGSCCQLHVKARAHGWTIAKMFCTIIAEYSTQEITAAGLESCIQTFC